MCLHNLSTGTVTQLLTEVKSWLNLGTVPVNFAPTTKKLVCGGGLNTTLCGMTIVVELDEKAQFKNFLALTTTYRGCTQRWSSPDGRSIWFAHHDPMHKGAILLWSMKPDGTDAKRFWRTQDAFPGYGMYCESPDGRMFVYSGAHGGDIFVVRYADGASLKLTTKQGSNMAPYWHRGIKTP